MRGKMPRRHLPVCALLQEQGLLLLQLVNVFDLMVPVLLLGVRVQGVRGQMPWRHMPVCALLQEQGLLLAPAGERVRSNSSCFNPRCQSSRGAGSSAQAPPASLCATPRTRTSPGSSW